MWTRRHFDNYSVTAYAHEREFLEALSRSANLIGLYVSVASDDEAAWAILEQGLIYETMAESQTKLEDTAGPNGYLALALNSYNRVLRDYPNTEAAEFISELLGEGYPGAQVSEVVEDLLQPAYPNPFNPATTITYHVPEVSDVRLVIYDLPGREVAQLVNGIKVGGTYRVLWNGKDKFGNPVSSGMYFYSFYSRSVESDKELHQTRKMILLR